VESERKDRAPAWGTGSVTFGGVFHVLVQRPGVNSWLRRETLCGTWAHGRGSGLFDDEWGFASAGEAWASIKGRARACKRCRREMALRRGE